MTPDERVDGKLQEMLRQLVLIPEFAPIAEFWGAHPDITVPFIDVVMSGYKTAYRSERKRKGKEFRKAAAELKELGLDPEQSKPQPPKPQPPSAGKKPIAPEHPQSADINDMIRQAGTEAFRHSDLAFEILNSEWDLERKSPFTIEQERRFLQDMVNLPQITDGQKVRLVITAEDFVRWLNKNHAISLAAQTKTQTNRNANGGI